MKRELVTIIVPIYKVEKYLPKCIESLIHQTYENLEIILVNDGSPDNCGEICDKYSKKDNRIQVIHKQNGGLSDARNKAIKIAKGDYILLADSDDWIPLDAVENMYSLAKEKECDIVVGQANIVYELKEKKEIKENEAYIKEYSNKEALEVMLYNSEITNMACNKLYKRQLFNGIEYPVGKLYEDLATTYKLIAKSKKVVVTSKKTYNYLIDRNDSIMNTKFNINRMQALQFTEKILQFVRENYPDIEKAAISRLYMECIFILLKLPYAKEYKEENRKIKRYLRKYRIRVLSNSKVPKKQKMLCIVAIGGRIPLRMIWNLKETMKKKGK